MIPETINSLIENSTIDVVIPIYHPDQRLRQLLELLLHQTVNIQHIYLMQTVDHAGEALYSVPDTRISAHQVLKSEFDHGATRNLGALLSQASFLVFMTQDAMPFDHQLIEALLKPFRDAHVGIAYARQLPRQKADMVERLTRLHNYPENSRYKTEKDIARLGIQTYFCSDVCAMYRRSYFDQLGHFQTPMIFNEDMIMAYHMIHAGFSVAYVAEAKVIHSHHYTCRQQFHRNFDLGVSQKQYQTIFENISSEKEGAGYVGSILKKLLRQGKFITAFYFCCQCAFKLAGYTLGKHYTRLSKRTIVKCTMNPDFWKNNE